MPTDGDTVEGESTEGEMMGEQPEMMEQPELPVPILEDINLSGMIEIDAFGDSIVRGVGDGTSIGEEVEVAPRPSGEAGFPLRIENLLGLPVSNLGDPGERLSSQGLIRFIETVLPRRSDFVIISGGTNDAIDLIDREDFFRSIQTLVNLARANGISPILATVPPTCCENSGIEPIIRGYNQEVRTLAAINELPLADVARAYDNTCGTRSCFLLNRPEGIHPNTIGYDTSGEVFIATLLNIDIFAPDGPSLLAQALDLPASDIITVPDPAPPAPATRNSELALAH